MGGELEAVSAIELAQCFRKTECIPICGNIGVWYWLGYGRTRYCRDVGVLKIVGDDDDDAWRPTFFSAGRDRPQRVSSELGLARGTGPAPGARVRHFTGDRGSRCFIAKGRVDAKSASLFRPPINESSPCLGFPFGPPSPRQTPTTHQTFDSPLPFPLDPEGP
jgi:hypothetical protein